jgi:AraC family transcriptional activator of tynA and feaB
VLDALVEPHAQRYDELIRWGECVNETLVNLDFSTGSRDFSGSYQYLRSRDCVAARLFGTAHRTLRSQRKLREVDNDFVLLLHLRRGRAMIAHKHFDAIVPEGGFIALDSSKPHSLEMREDFEHLVLRLPKARFISLHPAVSSLLDRPLVGHSNEGAAAGRMLDMMVSLGGAMPSTMSTMSDAVVKLLGDWIVREGGTPDKSIRHDMLARRILKCLDDNFTDPTFGAARLAEEVGISRRYVDSIFAESNSTFGKELLERRLGRCQALLTDASNLHRSITEIAFESGFNDLSHFSKRFRERFGISPRDARRNAYAH